MGILKRGSLIECTQRPQRLTVAGVSTVRGVDNDSLRVHELPGSVTRQNSSLDHAERSRSNRQVYLLRSWEGNRCEDDNSLGLRVHEDPRNLLTVKISASSDVVIVERRLLEVRTEAFAILDIAPSANFSASLAARYPKTDCLNRDAADSLRRDAAELSTET